MGVKEFAAKIERAVSQRLGDACQVRIQEVCKNNGVLLQGLVILQENQNISPTIYLNSFWEAYEAGVPLAAVVEKILSIYQEDTPKENVDMSFFRIFEAVKDRICYKLISADRNRELLEKIPHLEYLDLAICFYYAYQGEALGNGSILIHNNHLEMWQTDTAQVWEIAHENTPRLFPWECCSLETVFRDMEEEDEDKQGSDSEEEPLSDLIPMRILSNENRVFGASCILYPGLLEKIAGEQKSNLYLLPSSIHEVILLPDNGEEDADYLRAMISEVNESQVEPEEVLSNQLYYFDRHINKVSVV